MEKEVEKYTQKLSFNIGAPQNENLLAYNFTGLIDEIKRGDEWVEGGLNSKILLKNREKQIVLTALHKGTEIYSFQSGNSITLQIIEGNLKFHSRHESLFLKKGEVLTLKQKIKYSLKTNEETVFLLTIVKEALQPAEI